MVIKALNIDQVKWDSLVFEAAWDVLWCGLLFEMLSQV